MQFYKLELVNREQNYNKVFGAAPNVGKMDPMAAKKNAMNGAEPKMRLLAPGGGMNGMDGMGGLGGIGGMNMNLPPLGGMMSSNKLAGGNGQPPTMPRKSIQKRPSSSSLGPRQLQASN